MRNRRNPTRSHKAEIPLVGISTLAHLRLVRSLFVQGIAVGEPGVMGHLQYALHLRTFSKDDPAVSRQSFILFQRRQSG